MTQVKRQPRGLHVSALPVGLIAMAAPIATVLSTGVGLDTVGLVSIIALNAFMAVGCLVALTQPRRSGLDRGAYRVVGLLGICLGVSSLYAVVRNGLPLDMRSVLLIGHLLLPYFWFAITGPVIARYVSDGRATRYLLMSITAVAVWQLLHAGSVVLSEGANAWIALAESQPANSNAVGVLLTLGAAIALPNADGRRKHFGWPVVGIIIAAVIWTFSRSSFIALAAICVVHFTRSVRRWIRSVAIVGAAIMLFMAVPELAEAPMGRAAYTVQAGQLDPSSQARLVLWRAAIDAFTENPLAGIGFGQSVVARRPEGMLDPSRLTFAHNYFLTLASQTGVFGLVLGTMMLLKGFRLASQRLHLHIGEQAQLATIAIVVASCFGEPLLVPPILVAFLTILAGVTIKPRAVRA